MHRYITAYFEIFGFFRKNSLGFKFRGNKLMKNGSFEPEVTNYLIEQFKSRNKFFIDVGAHHGFFSCLANANKVEKIYSIEPDNLNFKVLRSNLAKNGFLRNTKSIKIAVGENFGKMKLYGFGTGNSAIQKWSGNVSRRVKSTTVDKLDSILSSDLPLKNAVVKIDVEGFELQVIKGALSTISSAINVIFIIELSWQRDDYNSPIIGIELKLNEIINFFEQNSYYIYSFAQSNGMDISLEKVSREQIINELKIFGSGNYVFKKV
jgi:FkbM family methyltransferase